MPDTANGIAIVLTHGAGSNAQAPLLVALAETFCRASFTVLRCDLPYRQVRSFGPPGPGDAARDRAGLKNAAAALAGQLPTSRKSGETACPEPVEGWGTPRPEDSLRKIFLGGHSYGGRQASMLCAEESDLVAGLLLLSYPLHPPRRPEEQRTQHLPDLRTPTLFGHGTRDPFGSIAEMERALKMIPARTKLVTIDGAGHDLGFKKAKAEELPSQILSAFTAFYDLSS